ncbi:RNA chaperone Hfq [Paenibacillus profundus]|uniref:RNA chaperone Hfq n=1 Tax=Paenibacillus profundus TaxID=1173085 RepID=A0ABS8YJX4_9BACL|nr:MULTISPECIES: RNA chaperone Hfq [Paenibacillus]MCE5170542.1 RNA chaperone Hfq [Paenibacillus profundus]MCM3340203.1 RNA chaperone Hfq [Paenibacillus sp. MER TA 81-3]
MVRIKVQEHFLNQLVSEKMMVTLITKNGVRMQGTITCFDTYSILLQTDLKSNLINKAAISTIVPSKRVSLSNHNDRGNTTN